MKLGLIKKHLANEANEKMLCIDNYKTHWLPYLKKKGIDKEIQKLLETHNIGKWVNEILFFAGYFRGEYEYAQWFANVNKGLSYKKSKTIESAHVEHIKQKNKLISLIDELNVRSIGFDGHENTSYIDSIVIKVIQSDNSTISLKIDNYSLCYDIANSLLEFLHISRINNGETPKIEFTNSNKKTTSYIKKFIQSTHPLFQFLKKGCNLNLSTDKAYFIIIADFLEAIGFNIENEFNQLPEDYIKDCYKQLKY